MADLESWLKDHKLTKIKTALEQNDIEELEDLRDLESIQDVDELIKDMELKVVLRKRFRKAVIQFLNLNDALPLHAVTIYVSSLF